MPFFYVHFTSIRQFRQALHSIHLFAIIIAGTVRNGRRLILPPKGGDGMGIYDLYVFLILLITLILVIKS